MRTFTRKWHVAALLAGMSVVSASAVENVPVRRGVPQNPFGDRGTEYLLVGSSMFDFTLPEEDMNVFGSGGRPCSYPVFITTDAERGKFQVYNLVNLSSDIDQLPVEGDYDPATGTMRIATNPWFTSTDETGVLAASGNNYIILQAGSPVGAGYWQDADELVINSESEGNVLTPASGFAAFGYEYDEYWEEFNSLNLYDVMYGTHLYRVREGVNILPSSYLLDAGECFLGKTRKVTFSIINAGTEESDYVVKVNGDGFTADVRTGSLEALDSDVVTVTFSPSSTGEYEGKIIIQSEGEDIEVVLKGECVAFPNFADIVTEGADIMKFNTSDDYPWHISTDIAEGPVAVSGNAGVDSSESSLIVTVTIPEGEKGVLDWSGFYDPHYGTRDEFSVTDNDEEVFCTPLKHQICDVAGKVNLLAGDHEIRFTYRKDMSVFPMDVEFGNDRTWLSNLNLKVSKYQPQAASIDNGDVDFDRFYLVIDGVEHEVDTPVLVNEGYETLKVEDVRGDGVFYGSVARKELAPEERANITVGFRADKAGEYEGDVTVVTSAGEYPVHCRVLVEPSPDYSPIVTKGEFIFLPDNTYPFVVEDGKAYNCTAGIADTEETLSLLTALFNVPAGKYGRLTWDGEADTQGNGWTCDYGVAMIDNNAYNLHYYHGHDYAGHYSADPYEIYLTPGGHLISWGYFQCGDGETYGADRLTISNLSLELLDRLPELEVWEPTPIDLGEVFDGSFNIRTIQVANLTENTISFDKGDKKGDFLLDFDEEMNSEIPGMSDGTIEISFTPSAPGAALEELTLSTEAGDLYIPVKGMGRDSSKMAFIEDFEGGISDWQVIDANNDKYRWNADVVGTYSRTGLGSVLIGTVFSDTTDDYLVSPEFTVPEEQPFLEYWRRYTKSDRNDYDVMIGEGSDPAGFDVVFSDEGHSQFEFEKITVDLSEYAGRKVRLAFHNRTSDGKKSVLILDDVAVGSGDSVGVGMIAGEAVAHEYLDLQGRPVAGVPAGAYIEKVVYADGSVVYFKRIK